MMYAAFSLRDRIAIRTSLVGAWLFMAVGALGGIVLTPITIATEIEGLATVSSWATFISALIAAMGVATGRDWIEWGAAWFTALGLSAYSVGIWFLVFNGTPTRLQQAGYITGLLGFVIVRAVMNSAHARKQRDIHAKTEEIKTSLEGDGNV